MEVAYAVMLVAIGLIQAAVVGVVAWLHNREAKKRDELNERTEKRATIRAEESRLAMQLMSANSGLAVATCMALKERRTNGKMDAALLTAEVAQNEYHAFVNRVAATQMTAD